MPATMQNACRTPSCAGMATVSLADALPGLARCSLTPVLLIGRGALAVAEELHRLTYPSRPRAPLVVVDCVWLPSGEAGRCLFGHEGKTKTRGYVDQANRGTLVLDNIECLESPEQIGMADMLDHMAFRRHGGLDRVPASLRLVAATREEPDDLIRTGRVHLALIRRLGVVAVRLP